MFMRVTKVILIALLLVPIPPLTLYTSHPAPSPLSPLSLTSPLQIRTVPEREKRVVRDRRMFE